jgi:hypothetical protein
MWSKQNYLDAGQDIGDKFVSSSGSKSINSLATKVAEKNNLDPEAIRTVVRIANNAAFQGLFQKSASSKEDDRMIEFEVGDPEMVISQLRSNAGEKIASIVSPGENVYDRAADYYGSLDPMEKVASGPECNLHYKDEKEEPVVNKKEVKQMFKDATRTLEGEKMAAEVKWSDSMEKAAQSYRVLITDEGNFYKGAVSVLGEDITPELQHLASLTKRAFPDYLKGADKVAYAIEFNVITPSDNEKRVFDLLKNAQEARYNFTRCQDGISYIASHAG